MVAPEAIAIWRKGVLVFQNQPLTAVLDQIRRYHPIDFTVPDASLQNKLISGRFAINELSTMLHTLSVGMNISIYQAEPGRFVIRKR
jgi:transmembrane sensor